MGYVHEVFNICCKYNLQWVWNGTINPKENPLARIKREVVAYHLKKDLERARKTNCIYTTLFLIGKKYGKKYRFEKIFEAMGLFKNTAVRRFFFYALFDTCAYSRKCPKCSSLTTDVLKHTLSNCVKTRKMRLILRLKLLLFNASKLFASSDLLNKTSLFSLSMIGQPYRSALCDYLAQVGYYSSGA